MSDDPNKRGRQDRQTVSSQPHEVGYAIGKLAQANPNVPREQVAKAIFAARDQIAPSEGRQKLMAAAQKKIDRS
jgi:hypothetical protein